MRFLRNRFVSKFLAVLFLILIVESTIHATVSYALTTGPQQPEYISYEEPGATDMVNLVTGDFSFSLPILDVPGPDGGFSVPLTYNAGIGPEQEASWVGLGWTLNVGAITRNIIQYPDDASGEVQSVRRVDLDGVRGWTSSALGFGQMGWNTAQGHYGSLSLLSLINYSYNSKGNTIGVVGLNVGPDGVSFDGAQFAMAAFTIATWGAGAAAAQAGTIAANIATQAAVSIAVGAVMSFVASSPTPNASADGYWSYNRKHESQEFLHNNYWIWLDQTRYEEMLGVLNFDKFKIDVASPIYLYQPPEKPVSLDLRVNGVARNLFEFGKTGNSKGIASDISYNIPLNTDYKDAISPVVIATDNYSVKAPGISGAIKPYRLEVGSVSMPRQMSKYHSRLALVTHLPYKVPFVYEGLNSNSYFHQVGGASTATSPSFYYGISVSLGTTNLETNPSLTYNLDDASFQNQIRPDLATTKKIPMANHVEWLSNDEIATTTSNFNSGFLDYFSGVERSQFRQLFTFGPQKQFYSSTNDITDGRVSLAQQDLTNFALNQTADFVITAFDANYDWAKNTGVSTTYSISRPVTSISTSPSFITADFSSLYGSIAGRYCEIIVKSGYPKRLNSIGGYSITGINGLTYHFALPSYEFSNFTRIEDITSPTTKFSEIKRDEPFANTWLLTGVTGSDFVDRGGPGDSPNGVIDESDWGYWVKFKYGKHADNYQWSIPFSTTGSTAGSATTVDASNTSKTRSNGYKQLFYLNTIETRTHVALFLKDSRLDNRGANSTSTLRLSEINLITREAYKKLFLPAVQGGFAMPTDAGIAKLWTINDFYSPTGSNHPSQGNFIIQNTLKRVKFTHTFDLCPGTPNSIAGNGGKLTLTKVSLVGRSDTKIVPDYKFEYANNPNYDANRWDGWGMVSSSATSTYNSHQASNLDSDGSAWSLTRITNPLGSTIDVDYERDSYSSISGKRSYGSPIGYGNAGVQAFFSGTNSCETLKVINASTFQIGDLVQIDGYCSYSGYGYFPPSYQLGNGSVSNQQYSGEFQIQAIDYVNNLISVGINFRNISYAQSNSFVNISWDGGTVKKILNKKGGNIRASALSLNDQGKQFKTRYLYTNDNGYSSGVVAREPEYIKTQDFDFYDMPGYPFTPVMYSQVTVLNGKLTNDEDYHTKQVFAFETPHQSMITNSGFSNPNFTLTASRQGEPQSGTYFNSYYKSIRNEISDYTSKIGKLKSIKLYSKQGTLPITSSDMVYTNATVKVVNRHPISNLIEDNQQGVYAEGTLMFDRIMLFGGASNNTYYDYHKISRTTIIKYPSVLAKVINTKDGFTSETENKVWDFISGQVVEKTEKSPLGQRTRTVIKPAFRVPEYAQMGSKAMDINNKNMLGHEAASYTYQIDAVGNNIGLLSASAQTWKSNWENYRIFNGTNFIDGNEPESQAKPVWRRAANYVYKGTYANLRADGSLSFAPSQEFSFASGAANTGWQKTGEVTRYDHYSAALEGKDLNNIFSSSKKDISAKQVYANSSNATYHEFAYSGAEDWDASGTGTYLGGEVAKGDGTKVTKTPTGTETHTGQFAVVVPNTNGKSFKYYRSVSQNSPLVNNRVYRVSAWTNSLAGAIYYSLNGGAEQTILPVSTMKVGNWYQINAEIPVSTFSSLEVGVKSTSGTVSFDDFRFQPRDGSLTANVYDPVTGSVTFVLDNQNMFTQYEYNDRGQLVKTYSESFLYGVKLVSESKVNYKGFNTN
jgi:hypothetical protein